MQEIKAVLEEFACVEFGYESLEDLIEAFRDGDEDAGYELAEVIIHAVEEVIKQKLMWHTEVLHDDLKLSREILFIAVDPQTRVCLTARDNSIGIIYLLESEADVINTVLSLSETVTRS